MDRWSCFFELGPIPLNLLICSSVIEMWWQGKENNTVMYWFLSHCCDMLVQQYQCKAERVYFNLQFQEQFIVVGKSRWQKAEVAVVTSRLQACRSALSFHLQSPGPEPHRMVPPIADRPSHLNLHNQDYLPQTHPNAHFPGDSRLKFTINPNPKVKVDKCPGYCVLL